MSVPINWMKANKTCNERWIEVVYSLNVLINVAAKILPMKPAVNTTVVKTRGICCRNMSVCLSVRLFVTSRTGALSKPMEFFHHPDPSAISSLFCYTGWSQIVPRQSSGPHLGHCIKFLPLPIYTSIRHYTFHLQLAAIWHDYRFVKTVRCRESPVGSTVTDAYIN